MSKRFGPALETARYYRQVQIRVKRISSSCSGHAARAESAARSVQQFNSDSAPQSDSLPPPPALSPPFSLALFQPVVKLRDKNAGTKGLQIGAEKGSTILRFSSGKFEELLTGLH